MLNFLNNSVLHKCCQRYALFQKLFQTEIVKHSISYRKVSGRVCLSPPGGELQVSKDWHFQNITMDENGKVSSLKSRTLSKIP